MEIHQSAIQLFVVHPRDDSLVVRVRNQQGEAKAV